METSVKMESPLARRRVPREPARVDAFDKSQFQTMLTEAIAAAVPQPAPAATLPKFGALAQDWLQRIRAHRVEPENERRHVDHMKPLWPHDEDKLIKSTIEEHFNALLEAGELGPATINKLRSTGRLIIEDAQANKTWGVKNPFELVQPLDEDEKVYITLDPNEIFAVQPHFRADRLREFRTALYTAMRPGEMLALQKEDIDLLKMTIYIHRSRGRDKTKTGKSRLIPLPKPIAGDLMEAIRVSPSVWVFPRLTDGQRQDETKMTDILRTAMGKAKLCPTWLYKCRRRGCGYSVEFGNHATDLECAKCEMILWAVPQPKAVTWYGIRHTWATLTKKAGVSDLARKLVMGHSIRDITDGTYTHLSLDDLRHEMGKFENFLTDAERKLTMIR